MITELRAKIAKYASRQADTQSWESCRQNIGLYSYLAFLYLAIISLEPKCQFEDISKLVRQYKLEDPEITKYVLNAEYADALFEDLKTIGIDSHAIAETYQEFLSQDYNLQNGSINYSDGKKNRDVLGAYYTEEQFAYDITCKAIEDFFNDNNNIGKAVQIADLSCGGGAFLVAAGTICTSREIDACLFGYDVDPIAVIITRLRLIWLNSEYVKSVEIVLGNPLLIDANTSNNKLHNFCLALAGRYYNTSLGIKPTENMDIVVGNPPWEKIRFEEKKFLSHFLPTSKIGTKIERKNALSTVDALNKEYFNKFVSDYDDSKKQIKKNHYFKLTNCGELNTYALFTEASINLINERGRIGLIVKSSLVKVPSYTNFFSSIVEEGKVYEIYMFVNKKKIFSIDSREEFSVIFLRASGKEQFEIAFNIEDIHEFTAAEKIEITSRLLQRLNPETGMVPNIKNNRELTFLEKMYKQNSLFELEFPDCKFGRLVHLTNHSKDIIKQRGKEYLPIYEGKFIEQYSGKYATFKNVPDEDRYTNKATAKVIHNSNELPEARFFIQEDAWNKISKAFSNGYVVAWRSLTSSTNRRTMLATLLPKVPTCQSIQLLQTNENREQLYILALFNSIIFDYLVRLKMAGLDLTQTIIKQIPVPTKDKFERIITFGGKKKSIGEHIIDRVAALYEDDIRFSDLFVSVPLINEGKDRKTTIAEIDMLIASLYGIDKTELKQIASRFEQFYSSKEEIDELFHV